MCFEWKNRFTCGHIGFNKVERCTLLGTGCYGPDGTEKFLEFGRLCYDCNARLLDPIPMSGPSDPFSFRRAMTMGHFSPYPPAAIEGREAAAITAGGEEVAGDGGEGEGQGAGGRGGEEGLRGRAGAPGSEGGRGGGGGGQTVRGTAAAAAGRPRGAEGVLDAGPPAPAQVGSPGNMSVGSLARSGSRSGSASSGQEGN